MFERPGPATRRVNVFNGVWIIAAFVSKTVVLDLFGFDYRLLRDPFSLTKLGIDLGTLIGFILLYRWLLGLVWKPDSTK